MKPKARVPRWLVLGSLVLWTTSLFSAGAGVQADPAGADGSPSPSGPSRQGLYVPPTSAFIGDPAEVAVRLDPGQVPLSQVQQQLDEARAANPDAPIVLTLTGVYLVTSAPLMLPSKTSLVLYGTILAFPFASAPSMIAVSGQSEVAVSGGHLEGLGAELAGIDVEGGAKINIDAVTVSNTGRDGIVLNGRGNDVWDSGSAITRCEVTRAGG